MKTIMILLNEPDESKEFIRYAILLAKDLGVKAQVLYVQNPPVYPHQVNDTMSLAEAQVQDDIRQTAETTKNKVEEMIREIKKEVLSTTAFDYITEIGFPSNILEEKFASGQFDMIMLQGQSDETLLSQTPSTLKIIRNLKCPIWIIAPNTRYRPFKKIIYATDYQEKDVTTIIRLIDLIKPYTVEITTLHISDNDIFEEEIKNAGLNEILKQKTGFDKIATKLVKNKKRRDVAEILSEEADSNGADLIVVLKENRSFIERVFKSSLTDKLIKKAHLPILVFHEK